VAESGIGSTDFTPGTNDNVSFVQHRQGAGLTVEPDQLSVPESQAAEARVRTETIVPAGSLYIPSLDGIRAISFFLVFFAHAGLGDIVPGGFGVSVFFLLSGYLITTLLRAEFARHGRISLGSFYLRRVLRILPPLYVVLALAIVLTLIARGIPGIPVAGTVAQALQVSNFYEIHASDPRTMPGTTVLWSLAVEEHFYLIFPLLYLWMCPRIPAGRQAALLLGICAVALVWRCILRFHFDATVVRTYYGTDTRFDCILFGCVLAVIANPVFRDPMHHWFLRQTRWLLPLCAAVLLGTFLIRSQDFRETFRYTLQGLALIPLFIAAIHYQQSWPVRMLNLPVVRFLGVLSYTLYLCHAIFLDGINAAWKPDPVVAGAASLACALGFSTLVHYLVERPCTRLRKRLSGASHG
jgi:peptidoglycan/LPS O-acetylase OafA/YrhL